MNHELERSGIQCRGPGVRGPVSQRGSGAREGLGVKEGPRESEGPGNQRCPVVRGIRGEAARGPRVRGDRESEGAL